MVRLLTDGKYLIILFKFDKDIINFIKEKLPIAAYDPSRKKWITPLTLDAFYRVRKAFPDSCIDSSLSNYNWEESDKNIPIIYTPPASFKPWKHQITTFETCIKNKQWGVFNYMRTGKTLTVLMVLDYLFKAGKIRKAIIIAPSRVIPLGWQQDATEHFPWLMPELIKKKKILSETGVFIIDWEMIKLFDTIKFDFDAVIIDESAKIRNTATKRFMVLRKYLPTKYTYILSGIPAPNTPLEYFAQFYIMDGGKTFGVNQYEFLKEHAVKGKYKWYVTKDGFRKIKEKVVSRSIRFELRDCIDLMPNTILYREVELDPEHYSAYKTLLDENKLMMSSGEITISNILTKTGKLLQAASGYVYANKNTYTLSKSNGKVEALKEIFEEEIGKNAQVILYAYYKAQIEHIYQELSKEYTISLAYGDSHSKLDLERFLHGSNQILLANPESIGYGLTFTNAEGTIWFAPIYDYEIFDQARIRIMGASQKKPTWEMFMYAKDTVELKIYQGLIAKKNISDIVLNAVKNKDIKKRLEGVYQ